MATNSTYGSNLHSFRVRKITKFKTSFLYANITTFIKSLKKHETSRQLPEIRASLHRNGTRRRDLKRKLPSYHP